MYEYVPDTRYTRGWERGSRSLLEYRFFHVLSAQGLDSELYLRALVRFALETATIQLMAKSAQGIVRFNKLQGEWRLKTFSIWQLIGVH